MRFSIYFVASVLSAFGCTLSVIVTILLKRMHQNPLGKMVLHLSIVNLILAIQEIILEAINYEYKCSDSFSCFLLKLLLSSRIFTNCGSLMWTCCFAHCLYTLGTEGSEDFLKAKYNTYFSISYGATLITGIATYLLYSILVNYQELNTFYVVDIFVSSFLCIQTVITFIVSSNYYIKGFTFARHREIRISWILLLFPVILLACNLLHNVVVVGIQLFSNAVSTSAWDFSLAVWVLQGCLTSLVYGLLGGVNEAIKEQCGQENPEPSELVGHNGITYHRHDANHNTN